MPNQHAPSRKAKSVKVEDDWWERYRVATAAAGITRTDEINDHIRTYVENYERTLR